MCCALSPAGCVRKGGGVIRGAQESFRRGGRSAAKRPQRRRQRSRATQAARTCARRLDVSRAAPKHCAGDPARGSRNETVSTKCISSARLAPWKRGSSSAIGTRTRAAVARAAEPAWQAMCDSVQREQRTGQHGKRSGRALKRARPAAPVVQCSAWRLALAHALVSPARLQWASRLLCICVTARVCINS